MALDEILAQTNTNKQTKSTTTKTFVCTIDGGASTGKGTTAKLLSKLLECYHLDTGALYRTVTYATVQNGISPDDEDKIVEMLQNNDPETGIKFEFDENKKQHNCFAGKDLHEEIRSEDFASVVTRVSKHKNVRAILRKLVRDFVKKNDCVVEGRDVGKVVLPDADMKYYVTADPYVATWRRMHQENIPPIAFATAFSQVTTRNQTDAKNLAPGEGVVFIDITEHTPLITAEEAAARLIERHPSKREQVTKNLVVMREQMSGAPMNKA